MNCRISLPNGQAVECPILYKQVLIVIVEHEFTGNLIQFYMSEFNIILGMDWLTTHEANIDGRDLKVTLKDPEG